MRFFLFIVVCFMTLKGACQTTFASDNRNSVKLNYGLFYPIKSQFRNPIQNSNNTLDNPMAFISVGVEHPRGYGRRNNFFELGVNFFLNEERTNPDLTKTNWFAGSLFMVYKYDIFPKNKYLDFYFGIGGLLGTQLLTVKQTNTETYFNFNASIMPHAELRIQPLKRISIGASADFLYDGTKTKWYTFDARTYPIGYTRFTGTILKFFIGWCWGN